MAKIHLNEFPFFGIAERAVKSVQLLDYTFGWNSPETPEQCSWASSSTAEGLLSARVKAIIEEQTMRDRELYSFGCELFQWRYTLMLIRLVRAEFAERWWAQNAHRSGCWMIMGRLSTGSGRYSRMLMKILERLAPR